MILLGEEPSPPSDVLSIGLGIAAVILVAGWILMRWHRDQMRFSLMRTALERGVTRFPGTPPYWLVSLRQGVTLVVVGAGLGVLGAGAWWMVRGVEMPAVTQVAPPQSGEPKDTGGTPVPRESQQRPQPQDRPEGRPGPRGPEDREFGRPPRPGEPPMRQDDERMPPPRMQGPRGEDRQAPGLVQPNRPGQPNRGPHDPAMEKWHRAEAQQTIGLVSIGVGFILLLLGMVRIGFAKVEQRYVADTDDATMY